MKSRADRILEAFEAELNGMGLPATAQALSAAIKKADAVKRALYVAEAPSFTTRWNGERFKSGTIDLKEFVNEIDSPELFKPDAPDEITVSQLAASEQDWCLGRLMGYGGMAPEDALKVVLKRAA
jgi:hypothetical protein